MTRTKKTFKGLLALLVSLSMIVALGVCVLAAAAETITETVKVEQTVSGSPSVTKYTYVLTPAESTNPMPEGTVDGVYTIKDVVGATTDETAPRFSILIDKSKAGFYEYTLEKTGTTPAGETVTPEKYVFGYIVRVGKDGNMEVVPYICQGGEPVEKAEFDEQGNPKMLALAFNLNRPEEPSTEKGEKGDKGDPGQDGTDGKNGKDGTNGRNGTNGTNGKNGTTTIKTITQSVGKAINTGDPNHILLWGGVIIASAGALVIIAILRRKKEKEEENN